MKRNVSVAISSLVKTLSEIAGWKRASPRVLHLIFTVIIYVEIMCRAARQEHRWNPIWRFLGLS